jgi:hypothetical protein
MHHPPGLTHPSRTPLRQVSWSRLDSALVGRPAPGETVTDFNTCCKIPCHSTQTLSPSWPHKIYCLWGRCALRAASCGSCPATNHNGFHAPPLISFSPLSRRFNCQRSSVYCVMSGSDYSYRSPIRLYCPKQERYTESDNPKYWLCPYPQATIPPRGPSAKQSRLVYKNPSILH